MRIATRLWLVFIVEVVVVLTVGVTLRLRTDQRAVLDAAMRNRRFFAYALQVAIAHPQGGAESLATARAMVAREEVASAHIAARLVSRSGTEGSPRFTVPDAERATFRREGIAVSLVGSEIVTHVAIDDARDLSIELRDPHAVPRILARVGWRTLIAQVVALTALAGVVTFAIVGLLVGRPLRRLARFAQQVGAGDFDARVDARFDALGHDEVATLGAEMNHMAERLKAARRALEEADAERVAAMEQLRHADRLRTVGQLASTLAHEMGTPLNVVSGHARMIEQHPGVGDELRESARAVIEQSARIARTLRELLDYARSGGAQVAEHDLVTLSEGAAHTLAPLTRRNGVRVEIEGKAPVTARVDAQQVLQVLTNLIVNAVHAMPEGGVVTLRVDAVDATPPTGVHARAGRYARVAVCDTGVGIAAEDVPRLFEPFFTRKRAGEGTGLGLAVVEGIVRDHGGWVRVESAPGAGSRFEVYLAIARA